MRTKSLTSSENGIILKYVQIFDFCMKHLRNKGSLFILTRFIPSKNLKICNVTDICGEIKLLVFEADRLS